MKRIRTFVWCVAIATCVAPGGEAQIHTAASAGAIAGTVRDQTDAPLPGAMVTLIAERHKRALETVTDAAGRYLVAGVTPGRYEVVIALLNFTTARRPMIDVAAGQATTIDATLQLSLSAEVIVTASRTFRNLADVERPAESLIGFAHAASQGAVTARQIETRPLARPGDVVETVPGVVVSQHSGDGKANQFFLRGFNLDHGTDFATTVAGIPVNLPTHGHGHGYTDLNFLIPDLVTGVQFKKGPYYAEEGDFSSAGAAHIAYASVLTAPMATLATGGDGWRRIVAAASPRVAGGHLLSAIDVSGNDGPWEVPGDHRKASGVVRYTRGDRANHVALTGMSYRATWNATDQVPARAVSAGALNRLGTVDATDGGATYRHSLSVEVERAGVRSLTRATVFGLGYGLNLYSNFTYFLDDQSNGDQFEQEDRRLVSGGRVTHARQARFGARLVEHRVGGEVRHDGVRSLGLYKTRQRARLGTVRRDRVAQTSIGLWGQTEVQWARWLRTTTGVRADTFGFTVDADLTANGGRRAAALASPKLGVVLGPWQKSEWYVNAGTGFHSNDARGVTLRIDPVSREPAEGVTPLVRTRGTELGLRSVAIPGVQMTVAVWRLSLDSELVFVGDAGTTAASRPSVRYGLEWSAYARPRPWLMVDADVSWSRAQFVDDDPAGPLVPGAAPRVASVGATADLGTAFHGGLRWRYVGARPLVEDGSVNSRGAGLLNGEIKRRLWKGVAITLEALNLLSTQASDIDYFYTSRLPGEPSSGVADLHTHPTVPRTFRVQFSISR